LVDGEVVLARLSRLERSLHKLDAIAAAGREGFLASEELQERAERNLQVALQICLDIGAHLVADRALPPPTSNASIFAALGAEGVISGELAGHLARAAGLRNILVHDYLELEPAKVFDALGSLCDLRAFAAAVVRALDDDATA
jgi:uncharacterized protein YutE (UPF0331/DUF86 family)